MIEKISIEFECLKFTGANCQEMAAFMKGDFVSYEPVEGPKVVRVYNASKSLYVAADDYLVKSPDGSYFVCGEQFRFEIT